MTSPLGFTDALAARRLTELPVERVLVADLVVVGTGVAGLTAALGASGRRVHLLTKSAFAAGGGSSPWAQGGVAVALAPDDSPALHAADTLAAGAGLNDPAAVEILTREGPDAVRQLIALGARFDRDAEGKLAFGREAAHQRRRVLHARDATGAEIVRALLSAVSNAAGIAVHEHCFAWDLVTYAGRVIGVVALHDGGQPVLHLAPAVVLATGGCGQLFARTTNPVEVTGDGIAMAARAGARMIDMAFVQFHPTALDVGADPMPLVTEALRGEGATLVDETGRRFMLPQHPQAELAPRDLVARAIWRELDAGRRVFLDARAALGDRFPERFPTVFALCQAYDIDPRREPIPVAPAAHYFMGGIAVDAAGRSSLPGLWACGEASSTGVHGANRLASNSLLEGLVYGHRVAASILETLDRDQPAPVPQALEAHAAAAHELPRPSPFAAPASQAPADSLSRSVAHLRRRMWDSAGLVRDAAGLEALLDELPAIQASLAPFAVSRRRGEARNLVELARMVAGAALARRESRGGHFRSDYPDTDPAQARRSASVASVREPSAASRRDRLPQPRTEPLSAD
ncbi:MAG: L-aspartate oxidase [Chloroflexi bacterium]|nr:L-aspartate oxidase [Chloroflexota bacterium]